MVKIFVGGLHDNSITSTDLEKMFKEYGKVDECDIVKNFAFVHMADVKEAEAAVAGLNGRQVGDVNIHVEFSSATSGGGRGGPRDAFRGRGRGRPPRGDYDGYYGDEGYYEEDPYRPPAVFRGRGGPLPPRGRGYPPRGGPGRVPPHPGYYGEEGYYGEDPYAAGYPDDNGYHAHPGPRGRGRPGYGHPPYRDPSGHDYYKGIENAVVSQPRAPRPPPEIFHYVDSAGLSRDPTMRPPPEYYYYRLRAYENVAS